MTPATTDQLTEKPPKNKDDHQQPTPLQKKDTQPISNYQRREQSDENFRQSIAEQNSEVNANCDLDSVMDGENDADGDDK